MAVWDANMLITVMIVWLAPYMQCNLSHIFTVFLSKTDEKLINSLASSMSVCTEWPSVDKRSSIVEPCMHVYSLKSTVKMSPCKNL